MWRMATTDDESKRQAQKPRVEMRAERGPCLVCTDARSQIGPFQPFRVNRFRPTSVYIRIGPTKMAYFRVHDGSNISGDQDPFLANFPVR